LSPNDRFYGSVCFPILAELSDFTLSHLEGNPFNYDTKPTEVYKLKIHKCVIQSVWEEI